MMRNRTGLIGRLNRKVTTGEVILSLAIVVIVIIILSPTTGRPREAARKSTCQRNLKGCVTALQIYWTDYDGKLPSSMLVSHSKEWNSSNYVAFATRAGRVPYNRNERPKTWRQLFYRYIYNKDLGFCPSDDADYNDPNAQTSYWWKLAIDKAWYGEGCKSPCQNVKDFAFSADQIVLYEHRAWHFDRREIKNGCQINAVFLDGHVKTISVKNGPSKASISPLTLGEPMYFNCIGKEKNNVKYPAPGVAKFIDPRVYMDRL